MINDINMKTVADIAQMSDVRNQLMVLLNNTALTSKDDSSQLRRIVTQLDKKVISLALNGLFSKDEGLEPPKPALEEPKEYEYLNNKALLSPVRKKTASKKTVSKK